MITSLRLRNFRGFDDHALPFGPMTVIVGQNNAGKSTIVEALRLLSMVVLRYRNLGFRDPPSDIDIPRNFVGVAPSLKNVEINFKTIFHHYGEPPGIVVATFENSASITVYVLADQKIHAVIRDANGRIIRNKQQANRVNLSAVRIMPQVAPLQRTETILSTDYVIAAMSSRLAPLHFRNQLNVQYELFDDFKRVVEETWPGVLIYELIGQGGLPGEELHLEVRNEDFVAEVGEMGHGLQMWLQTMWFLTMAHGTPTVILDEPDVYMHADLQRRIIRFLRSRHAQTIVTTHSVEIISEVQPDEILVVNKRNQESSFASSVPAVQAAIERFGSVHNIHLTRLLSARRVILVEGKDLKLLKEFQDTFFPNSDNPLQGLPNMPIGGWTGWKLALGTSMGFQNALGESIKTYCILDSDYHSPDEIVERYREAKQRDVELHIWMQKEIENYLLVPRAICRIISCRVAGRTKKPTTQEVSDILKSLADSLEDVVLDAMATEFWGRDRSIGQAGANRSARQRIRAVREEKGDIISLVSGKQLISLLADWSQAEFGVSLSALSIAREMTAREISSEVFAVLVAIEHGNPFPIGPTIGSTAPSKNMLSGSQ